MLVDACPGMRCMQLPVRVTVCVIPGAIKVYSIFCPGKRHSAVHIYLTSLILSITALCNPLNAQERQTSLATVQLEWQNGYWIMDVSAGASEAHRALQAYYKDKDLSKLDISEYNRLFLKYLLPRIEVTMDSQRVVFKQVNFGTNSVEAKAKLISPRFEHPQRTMHIHINAFDENEGHITTVNAYDGEEVRQQLLNRENDFTAVLRFSE